MSSTALSNSTAESHPLQGVNTAPLNSVVLAHVAMVKLAQTKPTEITEDISLLYVRKAFNVANKNHVLLLLDYGIDVFSTFCPGGCRDGQERWVIDFYGLNSTLSRDTLQEHKAEVLKAYRKNKWKIGLVGGSIRRFNRRKSFICFLERYVQNNKNEELRDQVKRLMSVGIVQSTIASFL